MTDDRLCSLIHRIAPPRHLAWGVAHASGEDGQFPEEIAAMARAVPQRRAEFFAGRRAARSAMARIGLPAVPIPMGPDRAPVWPDGILGSITHVNRHCIAVVGWGRDLRAVGIDIETDTPLDDDLIPEICRPEELTGIPKSAWPIHAKRIFSAKEAAYKAHYPLARQIFGFHGLSVDLTKGRARFTDHPEVAEIAAESGLDLPLRQAFGGGLILSLCLASHPISQS